MALTATGVCSGKLDPHASPRRKRAYSSVGPATFLARHLGTRQVAMKLAYPMREFFYSLPHLLRGPEFDAIRGFGPDLVFSNLGTLCMCALALRLSKSLNSPMVPFFTDDWMTVDNKATYFAPFLRRRLHASVERILQAADVRLAISNAMATEYEHRYGGTFLPFTQAVDSSRFEPTWPARADGAAVRLVYAGNVNANRWQGLQKLARALLALRAQGVAAEPP